MSDLEPEGEPAVAELAALPREEAPPPELEGRVVAALAERGLLRRRRGGGAGGWASLAAASLLAFAVGWLARGGPSSGGPPAAATAGPEFLLLLAGGVDQPPEAEAARVAEYRAWAGDLRRRGLLVSAERLAPRAVELGGGAAGTGIEDVSGFFLLRARDLDEAVALAGTCPHLRHGGRVTVRPVAPT
jgi:hypothetical protein